MTHDSPFVPGAKVAERTIPEEEYARLLRAAECDDALIWCEVCGAWMDRDDPAAIETEDFRGCLKAGTRDSQYDHLCRSHRALK